MFFFLDVLAGASERRGVRTDFDGAKSDHGTVDFVNNAIDFLEVVGIGNDLVTSDDILFSEKNVSNGNPPTT